MQGKFLSLGTFQGYLLNIDCVATLPYSLINSSPAPAIIGGTERPTPSAATF